MKYNKIKQGIFIERPNRFIAHVLIDGVIEICHVKNTGRCKELLSEGTIVWVEECPNPNRKTKYDLVMVKKNQLLINMDSQAPNQAVGEWLRGGGLYPEPNLVIAEKKVGDSRLDFYLEQGDRKAYVEVKGVTLERDGVAFFPDAPTLRGIKHIHHLIQLVKQGYEAYLIFVVQFQPVLHMEPNDETHLAFGEALRLAKKEGVTILCYDCIITPKTMDLANQVPVVYSKR